MDDYLYSMFDWPGTYAILLLSSLLVYFYAAKKTSVGWLDPWFAQQALSAAATTAVLFLFWIGKISFGTVLYHLLATLIFFVIAAHPSPLRLARRRARKPRNYWKPSFQETGRLQIAVFLILLASQLAMWSVTGLPVLLASRLDAAATGGGIGAFTRVLSVFGTIIVFLTVMRIGLRPKTYSFTRDGLILFAILLIQVANGSKANIIFTVFFFVTSNWLCRQVSTTYQPIVLRRGRVLFLTLVVTAFAFIPIILANIYHNVDIAEGPITQFASRAILSGDSYIHFWGSGWIDHFTKTSPTLLLAADLLGTLRLVPREWLPLHPGIELYRELFPFSEEVIGPNMRLDLFGLLYGGWLPGLIFVAFAALVFRFMRSFIFRARSTTTIMLSAHLFLNAPAVFIDPTLGEGVLFNAAISLPLLYVLSQITRSKRRRKKPAGDSDASPRQLGPVHLALPLPSNAK